MSDYKRTTHNPYSTEFAIPCYLCKHIEERPIRNKQKCSMEECDYLKCYEKLADLENQIENGTLIELPCKVGDTVYTVEYSRGSDEWFVKEYTVYGFSISEDRIGLYIDFGICAWSNDVYYTKAEAKAKLAERKGEQ